jgi:sugar lactone lactonase YvrE
MAANINPIFVLTPNVGTATVTTANTTRDLSSTTNAALLFTAGTDGSRVDTITFVHSSASQTQASVAAVGRIWITTSAAGANPRLLSEVALPVATPSATAAGQSQTITFANGLFLASGQFLWCAISATQTSGQYDVIARGGNY